MNIPDEVLTEAVAAVDKHWIVEQLNLGYYRTETKCVCGATWMSGDHDGDPDYHEQMEKHRLAVTAPIIAGWAFREAEAEVHAIPCWGNGNVSGFDVGPDPVRVVRDTIRRLVNGEH